MRNCFMEINKEIFTFWNDLLNFKIFCDFLFNTPILLGMFTKMWGLFNINLKAVDTIGNYSK